MSEKVDNTSEMVDNMIVYMHISPNGKRYIGTTKRTINSRSGMKGNCYSYNKLFWNDIQKYGWDNFEHIIVYEGLTEDEAYEKEKELIKQYNTCDSDYGYNKSIGGKIRALGVKHDAEFREKARQSKLGAKNPQYGKHSWNYGVPCREETKRKLHLANLGRPCPLKGIPLSEERKQHLHNINVGKIYVNNGEKEVCISKDELQQYLDKGYIRGYIVQRSHKNKKQVEK